MCNTCCNFDEWKSCETQLKVQLLFLFLPSISCSPLPLSLPLSFPPLKHPLQASYPRLIFSWSCQWLAWDGLGAILILRFGSCTCLQRDFLLSLYCCLFFWGIFPLTKISFVVSWPQMTILSFSFYFSEAYSSFGYFYAPFNIFMRMLFSFSH